MITCLDNFELKKCSAWLLQFSYSSKTLADLAIVCQEPPVGETWEVLTLSWANKPPNLRNAPYLQALRAESHSLAAWRCALNIIEWDYLIMRTELFWMFIYPASSLLVSTNTRVNVISACGMWRLKNWTVSMDRLLVQMLMWSTELYDTVTQYFKSEIQTQEVELVEPRSQSKRSKTGYIIAFLEQLCCWKVPRL